MVSPLPPVSHRAPVFGVVLPSHSHPIRPTHQDLDMVTVSARPFHTSGCSMFQCLGHAHQKHSMTTSAQIFWVLVGHCACHTFHKSVQCPMSMSVCAILFSHTKNNQWLFQLWYDGSILNFSVTQYPLACVRASWPWSLCFVPPSGTCMSTVQSRIERHVTQTDTAGWSCNMATACIVYHKLSRHSMSPVKADRHKASGFERDGDRQGAFWGMWGGCAIIQHSSTNVLTLPSSQNTKHKKLVVAAAFSVDAGSLLNTEVFQKRKHNGQSTWWS